MSKPAPPVAEMAPVEVTPPAHPVGNQKKDNLFCLSTPWDLLFPCNNCFVLPERANYVQLLWGKYHGTITEPGCYCRNALAVELRLVETNIITYDLSNTKVLDQRGNPIVISGIITYEIVDARKAAIDVSDPHRFVRDQAPAILKRVVSQFPYESEDPEEPSLRTETVTVATRMRDALQARCQVAGVRIETFSINELSYAPEIAQAMLKRQQAEALIAARKAIVNGAKDIARSAVADLGDGMDDRQKASLLSNLLVVLVGDKEVTPTVQV